LGGARRDGAAFKKEGIGEKRGKKKGREKEKSAHRGKTDAPTLRKRR
jgi:hypothetical protein